MKLGACSVVKRGLWLSMDTSVLEGSFLPLFLNRQDTQQEWRKWKGKCLGKHSWDEKSSEGIDTKRH